MLKMTVRPLAIRNSSMPNRTPLSVDMTINSSTTHHPRNESCVHPDQVHPDPVGRGERVALHRSVRPVHLAGGRQDGLRRVDLCNQFPAPAGFFLVKRFLLGALAE